MKNSISVYEIKNIMKRSIAAGIMISIGAVVKMCCENQVIGSFLFSIGLFFVCSLNMFLFTGKIGYINRENVLEYPFIWLGNLIGCIISMGLIRLAKPSFHEAAVNIAETKINYNLITLSVLSLFCGVLMFLAVNNYKKSNSEISKLFGVVIVVMVFLLSGFEHSIANMSYSVLYVSNISGFLECLKVVLVSTVFNGVGSVLMNVLLKDKKKEES